MTANKFNSQSSGHSIEDFKLVNFSFVLRTIIWLLGNIAWLFAILDRTIAMLTTNYLSVTGLLQISIATFLFWCWLFLKPNWKTTNKVRN
jgi:hypothetical protein